MVPSVTAERPDGRKPLDVLHLAIALCRYAARYTASASPVGGVRYRGTLEQRRSRLLAPRLGGGVRCAALIGCRVRPFTRCAASLRMTRGAPGRETKNKMPYLLEK